MLFYDPGDIFIDAGGSGADTLNRYTHAMVLVESISTGTGFNGLLQVKVAPSGDIYLLSRRLNGAPGVQNSAIYKMDGTTKTVSLFANLKALGVTQTSGSNPNATDINFDFAGNVYVHLANYLPSGLHAIGVCKLDTSGAVVWTKHIGGTFTDGGATLLSDDQTYLYAADPGSGVSTVRSYDIVGNVQNADAFTPPNPPAYGSPPFLFDIESIAAQGSDIFVGCENNENTGTAYDTTIAAGLVSGSPVFYESGATLRDSGYRVALDGDGVSLWASSISKAELVQFTISSGALVHLYTITEGSARAFAVAPGTIPPPPGVKMRVFAGWFGG